MKKYVITGGPGIGKTTLLEILSSRGYSIVPESARIIIEESILKNSNCLPWVDLKLFQDEVLKRQVESESKATGEIVFLDRGLIDGYAYCELGGIQPPEFIVNNGKNRYDKIFLLEQLPTYKTDESRVEDAQTAKNIHDAIESAYKKFGYEVVLVPAVKPEKRADFVIENIK